MKPEWMDNELVQTKGIIYSVAVLIVLDVISLFCPQKGFKKVLDLKHSYEFMELYQKYTQLPSLERSFFSNHDLPDVQTNQESPQLPSGVQTQTQHQFCNAQSPGPQCTANLAPQTKSFMGGRSRTQAAHQMYLASLLSSITQWDTAPNSTDRWDRILHGAPGGTTQEYTESSLLQLQATG